MSTERLLCVLALAAATGGAQQAVPGRLSGSWLLNSYLSDNPAQIAEAIRYDTGEAGDEFVGRGRPAGTKRPGPEEMPPSGRKDPAPERKDPLAPEDRKKVKELTDAIQFAPTTLAISQTDRDVTIVTATRGTTTLHPTGKAEEYKMEAGVIKRAAAWEGPVLVVTYDLDRAGILRYTYLVVPTTHQLLIRVRYERPSGPAGPFEMKLVYDRQPDS